MSEQEISGLKVQVDQLAAKLEAVDKELKRSQLAQAEFLTRMSHELNSPLSVIIGFSQLLENSSLTEDQCENLQEVIDAANYLNDQNQHLFKLSLAKNSPLKFEPVKIKEILDISLQHFAELIQKKNIIIDEECVCPNAEIQADPQYIKQVVDSLIINALHYTNPAGTVSLTIEQQAHSLYISIHDGGVGIPEQLYSEVFTLFHDRNVENVEGLGMGLYLAKEYVELMDGEIGFESIDNHGTTFWVTLPLNAEIEASPN